MEKGKNGDLSQSGNCGDMWFAQTNGKTLECLPKSCFSPMLLRKVGFRPTWMLGVDHQQSLSQLTAVTPSLLHPCLLQDKNENPSPPCTPSIQSKGCHKKPSVQTLSRTTQHFAPLIQEGKTHHFHVSYIIFTCACSWSSPASEHIKSHQIHKTSKGRKADPQDCETLWSWDPIFYCCGCSCSHHSCYYFSSASTWKADCNPASSLQNILSFFPFKKKNWLGNDRSAWPNSQSSRLT